MRNYEAEKNETDKINRIIVICIIAVGVILLSIGFIIFSSRQIRSARQAAAQEAITDSSETDSVVGSFVYNLFVAPIVLIGLGGLFVAIGTDSLIIQYTRRINPGPEAERERKLKRTGNYLYHPVFADYLHPNQYTVDGSGQKRYKLFDDKTAEQGTVEYTILIKRMRMAGLLFLIGIISGFLIGIFGSKLESSEIGLILLEILCYAGYGGCTIAAVMKFTRALHGTIKIRDIRRYRKAIGTAIQKKFGDEGLEHWNQRMARLDAYDGNSKD